MSNRNKRGKNQKTGAKKHKKPVSRRSSLQENLPPELQEVAIRQQQQLLETKLQKLPLQQQQQQQQPPKQQQQQPKAKPLLQTKQKSPVTEVPMEEDPQKEEKSKSSSDSNQSIYKSIPIRPGLSKAGILGEKIKVMTNITRIIFGPKFNCDIYCYCLSIYPEKPKHLMRKVFDIAKTKLFPNSIVAFDGKTTIYTVEKENVTTETVTVRIENEHGKKLDFKVKLRDKKQMNLSGLLKLGPGVDQLDQKTIKALNIILRTGQMMKYISVGESFYSPKNIARSLGIGIDLVAGLSQTLILGFKPYMNVNVVHKAFYTPQPVLDLMKAICKVNVGKSDENSSKLTKELIEKYKVDIKKYLKGLAIVYEIPSQPKKKRTLKFHDLVFSPRELWKKREKKTKKIHQHHLWERYYTVKYPDLPCLWLGTNNNKNIPVPPELCKIVAGQAVQKKLTSQQTSSTIKYAAMSSEKRLEKINSMFKKMRDKEDPCMRQFGISLNEELEKIPARVLEAPVLVQGKRRDNLDFIGGKTYFEFFKCSNLVMADESWSLVKVNENEKDSNFVNALNFINRMRNKALQFGFTIGKPLTMEHVQLTNENTEKLSDYFKQQKKRNMQFIFVVISKQKGLYGKVKQVSELNIGILTQCLKEETLSFTDDKLVACTIGNLLQKLNAKLNGINIVLETLSGTPGKDISMIVGADINHPPPSAKNKPSIATVAMSRDFNAFKYNIEMRLQPANTIIIQDLEEIIRNQINHFATINKTKPAKIIYFRNGVSDGQFVQVKAAELAAIKKACKTLNDDYKPKITFLMVQKKHNTRFFKIKSENEEEKKNETTDEKKKKPNVEVGTVVDTHIIHPTHIDFYLVSHESPRGIPRPTKYKCLWDDAEMSEDEIEKLTYSFCHTYSRCARPVSYPVPTYYARLAASRARSLIQGIRIDMQNLPQEQKDKLTINEDILNKSPMFFV